MIVLEIREIVLLFLLILTLAILGTAFFVRWRERRLQSMFIVESLKTLTDQLPAGVMLVDRAARTYRAANPYAQRLFQLPDADGSLPQKDWQEALKQDVDRASNKTIESNGVYRTIAVGHDSNAEPRFVRWWVVAWQNLRLTFSVDITERHQLEQNSQILISGLAHELRTPLATILTHVEILMLSNQSQDTHTQSTKFIQDEARRLMRLTDNSLALGRITTNLHVDVASVNLESLIDVVSSQMQAALDDAQLELLLEADSPLPFVLGNADYIKQIFINLLENCITYCNPKDQVTIAVRNDTQGVLCEVRDTGPGIDPKHLPHLTKRFYRAASAGTVGNGLGLALVQEILSQHQSQLIIESVQQQGDEGVSSGTSMKFVLPTLTA